MENLVRTIMDDIGLDLSGTYIVDQDYGNIVKLNGKNLRYFLNDEEKLSNPPTREDLIFDITNSRVTNLLLGYYLNKLTNLEGIYFKLFYMENDSNGYGSLSIIGNDELIKSKNKYFLDNLKHIDMIFTLSGREYDLSMYDKSKEVV